MWLTLSYRKTCANSLIHRELKIKIRLGYHFSHILSNIQKYNLFSVANVSWNRYFYTLLMGIQHGATLNKCLVKLHTNSHTHTFWSRSHFYIGFYPKDTLTEKRNGIRRELVVVQSFVTAKGQAWSNVQ